MHSGGYRHLSRSSLSISLYFACLMACWVGNWFWTGHSSVPPAHNSLGRLGGTRGSGTYLGVFHTIGYFRVGIVAAWWILQGYSQPQHASQTFSSSGQGQHGIGFGQPQQLDVSVPGLIRFSFKSFGCGGLIFFVEYLISIPHGLLHS